MPVSNTSPDSPKDRHLRMYRRYRETSHFFADASPRHASAPISVVCPNNSPFIPSPACQTRFQGIMFELPIQTDSEDQMFARKFRPVVVLLAVFMLAAISESRAEEGMWTFDNVPVKLLKEKYGFTPTQAWLDQLRLSSVRLNDGGSGSFVSPDGLLLTNHHVARGQLQKNSTAEHDYLRDGFYADTADKEMKSPDLEVNVLVGMENVTERVQGAAKGIGEEAKALKARDAEIA